MKELVLYTLSACEMKIIFISILSQCSAFPFVCVKKMFILWFYSINFFTFLKLEILHVTHLVTFLDELQEVA